MKNAQILKTLTLRLQPELFEKIRDAANEDRRSVAAWIRVACEDKLEEPEMIAVKEKS